MNSIQPRAAGPSRHFPISSITTSSTKAVTSRRGNSPDFFQEKFARASEHCGRARQRLQFDVIVAKISLVFALRQESSDDRALLFTPQPDSEETNANISTLDRRRFLGVPAM